MHSPVNISFFNAYDDKLEQDFECVWKKLNNYVLPSFISVQSFFAMIFNKTVDIKFSAHDEFLK